MNYKMRAECLTDVVRFLELAENITQLVIFRAGLFPDVEVSFHCPQPLSTVQAWLLKVPDSHVMRGTLELEKNYTGERKF